MGASKKTDHLLLSQFQDDDKPAWLGDYNGDMLKIDAAVTKQNLDISTANNLASTAQVMATDAKASGDAAQVAADTATKAATTATSTANAAKATAETADRNASASLTNSLNSVLKWNRATEIVIIGGTNSQNGTWFDYFVSKYGWLVHNYSAAGAGFTMGSTNQYANQVQMSVVDASVNPDNVGFVFIADASADIRSKKPYVDVNTQASATIIAALAAYPRARIIVLPALTTNHTTDAAPDIKRSLAQIVWALRGAAQARRVEFVDGSWTWHQDGSSYNVSGTNTFTDVGHNRTSTMLESWFAGQDVYVDTPWVDAPFSPMFEAFVAQTTASLASKRRGERITLAGAALVKTGVTANPLVCTLRPGMRPGYSITGVAYQAGTVIPFSVNSDGEVKLVGTPAVTAAPVQFNVEFDAF